MNNTDETVNQEINTVIDEDVYNVEEDKPPTEAEQLEAMNLLAVFDWSKVIGVTSTLKNCTVYFENGHNVNVQTPWFMEGHSAVLMTKQFGNYLKEKKEKEASRQENINQLNKKIQNIELALQYAPNDTIDSEFTKAKEHFKQLLTSN